MDLWPQTYDSIHLWEIPPVTDNHNLNHNGQASQDLRQVSADGPEKKALGFKELQEPESGGARG